MNSHQRATQTMQPLMPACLLPLAAEIRRSIRLALESLQSLEQANAASTLFYQAGAALELAGIDGVPALTALLQRLLASVAAGSVPLTNELVSAVRRSGNALLSYLDATLRGQPVPALSLFPLYRDLYALQGNGNVNPAALLSLHAVSALPLPDSLVADIAHPREQYEQALLEFLRSSEAHTRQHAAQKMAAVIDAIVQRQRTAAALPHWQILQGFTQLIAAGAQPASAKTLLAGIGRLIRHLDAGSDARVPAQLVREALFDIACASISTPLTQQIVAAYRLGWQLPVGYELALPNQEQMNAEALADFAVALAEVKSALENGDADAMLATTTVPAALRVLAAQAAGLSLPAGLSLTVQQLAECCAASDVRGHHAVPLAACLILIEQGLEEPEAMESSYAHSHAALQAALACCITVNKVHNVNSASTALPRLCDSRQQQLAWTALAATIAQTLALLENRLDAALQATSMVSVWPALDGMLAQVGGALSLIGEWRAVEQVRALRDMLAALEADDANADQATSAAALATRFAELVQQVAGLSWHAATAEESAAPALALITPIAAEELSLDMPLPDVEVPAVVEPAELTVTTDQGLTLSPALHAIYLEEAQGLIAHIIESIQQWCAAPHEPFLHAATRALHSLIGSSATVGFQAIQELATALEILLEDFLVAGAQPCDSDCVLLLESGAALDTMLAQLLANQLPVQQSALAQQLLDLSQKRRAAVMPAPLMPVPVSADVEEVEEINESTASSEPVEIEIDAQPAQTSAIPDPELLAIFIEEATELLFQLEQQLRAWQTEPAAPSPAPSLLRILHTLKGSARMAGAVALGEQLHQMENTLSQAESVGPAQIESLLVDLDCAMQLFAQLTPPAQSVQSTPVVATRSRREPPRAQQLQLRVRTDLLERVASSAAELVVGGARVNGELQQQRHALAELNDNLGRLRSQLREVEIQAETQIASSVAQSATREFDPLEFDRFTSLQELTRMMAETMADVMSVQRMLSRHVDSAALAMTAQLRHARTLQDDFRRVRIVQFSSIAERLHLLVRQVAHELARQVRLELQGGSVELDRSMLDKLGAPLEHLLRNAIAHGIEPPAQRLAAGKPAEGVVQITLAQQGNDIILQISDDGRGLDNERIRAQAVRAGLVAPDAQLTDAEIAALIFEPGLSTAAELTTLSGRGIGMDAVRADLQAQGGSIKVYSARASGTCFTLVLPLTLATTQVVLAKAGGTQIALPSAMVQQVLQLPAAQIRQARAAGSLAWRGEQLPLHNLATLMGQDLVSSLREELVPVVILRQLDGLLAIELDAVTGNREVVVKNIGPQLSQLAGLAGATVLADASIVLIINPLPLVEAAARRQRAGVVMARAETVVHAAAVVPLILVVDDSLTVRRVSQRLLEKHGYATLLARDGFDALEKLAAANGITPAVMLFDIEMPRMDGFDLLRHVRQDARLAAIPVVMITSRTAERHREHAMALGATAYLGKPFQETELLALLAQLCAQSTEAEA